MIPASNVIQLNLPPHIQKRYKRSGYIYQVKHVDEAIEILMGEVPVRWISIIFSQKTACTVKCKVAWLYWQTVMNTRVALSSDSSKK